MTESEGLALLKGDGLFERDRYRALVKGLQRVRFLAQRHDAQHHGGTNVELETLTSAYFASSVCLGQQ